MLNRIEADERWLAGFENPSPSQDALARVKRAVRIELRRDKDRAVPWRAWHGGLAAAAMLMLSVGVVKYAQWASPIERPDSFLNELVASIPADTSIDDTALDDLTDWPLGDSWVLSGASMYDVFEDALDDADADADDAEGAGAMMPVNLRLEGGVVG